MNSGELLTEGVNLMLLGMGTVFVFLTVLVLVTSLMSKLVLKYTPVQLQAPDSSKANGQPSEQTLLAIISAAIHAHRSKN